MPSLPFVRRGMLFALFALPLSACGSGNNATTNSVAMKDLEVTDGTATDAMTDLDGVKSEGTAMAPPASTNSTASSAAPKAAANATDPAQQADTEVIADQ